MPSVLAFCAAVLLQATPAKPQDPAPAPVQDNPGVPKPDGPTLKGLVESITIGGQVRFRAEYRDPVAYTNLPASREDDDLYLSRVRLNFTFALADQISIFIQPQDQRTFGEEGGVLNDTKGVDLHQGFVEARQLLGEPLAVKIGRQELAYGDQRIISNLDWSNPARAWDGGKVRYGTPSAWIDGFYTVIAEGTGAEDDQDFWGLYGSVMPFEAYELDGYVLGREFNNNAFTTEVGAIPGDLRDFTMGVRFKGNGAIEYSVEGVFQTGKFSDDDLRAFGFAGTLGFTFDLAWKPRVLLEYTYASGDQDPSDGDRETFDPPFPFSHAYQGYIDIVAWKNSHDVAFYFRVVPMENLSLHLDVHNFWLAEEKDAWYADSGAVIRRDPTGQADDRVGNEIDLHARLAVGRYTKLWAGGSHFFAGPFVKDTPGTDRDTDWFFFQVTFDF